MKKSMIALAISGAALSSVSAFAQDITVDVYGNIQYAYINNDSGTDLADNGSTFGFQGESVVDENLTTFFKYELELDADDKENEGSVNLDQAYVGLKGGFGKVQIGSFDTIYSNAIQDSLDQFEVFGIEGASDTDEGDTIAYFSPDLGGFEIQAAVQTKGSADVNTAETGNAVSAVVKYNLEALTFAVGYDSLENTSSDEATIGFAVDYQASPSLSVSFKAESTSDTEELVGVATRYGYGAGALYGSAQVVSPEVGDSYNEFAAGVSYDITSNMYVYAEVGQLSSSEESNTAVGVYYGF